MEIREIKEEERDSLLKLYKHLHQEDVPSEEVDLERTWSRIVNTPSFYCIGLFVESELVGSCCLVLIDNLTRGCRPYAIIENVVTHTHHRKKGYGKKMLNHCLDIAWSHTCYKVMLMTGRLNEETFSFYEAAGFDRYKKQAFIAKP